MLKEMTAPIWTEGGLASRRYTSEDAALWFALIPASRILNMSSGGRAAKWFSLTGPARLALLRAWVMGVVCLLALRIAKYEDVRRLMAILAGHGAMQLKEIVWAVDAALNRIPLSRCLERAMVGEALLKASGHQAMLRIGVSVEGEFGAHAWVEVAGVAVIGAIADREYQPMSGGGAAAE